MATVQHIRHVVWRALLTVVVIVMTLALAASLALCSRLAKCTFAPPPPTRQRGLVSEWQHILRPGDVILFASAAISPSTIVSGQFFSHAAIVVRTSNGTKCLAEMQPGLFMAPGVRMPFGATTTPLLERLKHYPGIYFVAFVSPVLDAAREKKLADAVAQLDGEPYPSWMQLALGAMGRGPEYKHCFQYVAHLLSAAGVHVAPEDATGIDICRIICNLHEARPSSGHRYTQPLQLLYDEDCI